MPVSRYIVVAVARCPPGLLALVRAAVELGEAEVAVGDAWAHGEFLGACHSLHIGRFGALDIWRIVTRVDFASLIPTPTTSAPTRTPMRVKSLRSDASRSTL